MNILGISGLANAGKSTAARVLVERHGYVEVALSDPLKRICRDVLAFTDEQLWGPSESRNAPDLRYPRVARGWAAKAMPPTHLTPRHALQQLGTQWGRNCFEDVWIDYGIRTARTLLTRSDAAYSAKRGIWWREDRRDSADMVGEAQGVAIPDIRFVNELDAIHAAGGRVIRIVRASAGLSGDAATHTSETEQAGIPDSAFDGVIYNDGTVEDLAAAIGAYVKAQAQDGAA